MRPQDRLHRSGPTPGGAGDRPPLLLGRLGKGARVRLTCGACAWSRTYDPYALVRRLQEKGAGGPNTLIAHVARHVQWPCPRCRKMGWFTSPEQALRAEPTSPSAAALAGGGPPAERSEERVVEGAGLTRDAGPISQQATPPARPTHDLITKRARAMRKQMTEPEVMLWSRLRGRTPERPTFRRQHPIGTIIVDFFCPRARLAIEVDGATHWDDDARARDAARDAWLERQGIAVLRIAAGEVYRDLGGVVDAILLRAEERRAEMSGMRPAPSTTPSAGRGPPPADAAASGEVGP